jgi:aspartate/methionine/tyrosine aminotransferase
MFSVSDDDPFIVFRKLQDIARESRGDDVIDLSRGDPGYGFSPSIRGREFGSYVIYLDSALNKEFSLKNITNVTNETYQPETAKRLLNMFREFIDSTIESAKAEGKNWDDESVLKELFGNSAMSGGSYLKPKGQDITRVIVSAWHRKEYGVDVKSEDLILTNGASHAIGTVFKALGEEGCGFLSKEDTAMIASPVYSPYNRILEEREIKTVTFSMSPLDGSIQIESSDNAKVLILIDPNNPTGFSLEQSNIEKLATLAKEKDMLVITDEVYSSFFPKKKTMLALAPERTIAINARSKIERSTGLRFGEIITLPEGRENISKMLGLKDSNALEELLIFAKGPGRAGGQFQHTTFVPGPSQLLGISHMVLGDIEREKYMKDLSENRAIFCNELSLKSEGNTYYIIFDLDSLPDCNTQNISMEERLTKLAEAGIVYIPAYRFFSEEDRKKSGVLTSVRASVVNTTPEKLREAAERTKSVLCNTV